MWGVATGWGGAQRGGAGQVWGAVSGRRWERAHAAARRGGQRGPARRGSAALAGPQRGPLSGESDHRVLAG